MKSGSMDSYRAALSGTGADIGGEPEERGDWWANEAGVLVKECGSCRGSGSIPDDEARFGHRKCMDCRGAGEVPAHSDSKER